MHKRNCRIVGVLLSLVLVFPVYAKLDKQTATALDTALNGDHRSAENKARDPFRKPKETLDFLGFRSDMTVVEIWPGGGWYTEILAPVLREKGKLYAAQWGLNGRYGFLRRSFGKFLSKLGEKPDIYRDVMITQLEFPYQLQLAPPGSVDMVLTFRNVHNWFMELMGGGKYADLGFQAAYDALKPGGVFGIVDHRWSDPKTEDPKSKNGYISEERTIAFAEAAGFKLIARSKLLDNPKDTKNHPEGVWTLPPTLALGDKEKDKYLDIGESDRFLLKFIKPKE